MAGTYSRTTGVLVIGGGPGGYVAAIRLGQLGRRTLLVEKDQLGGECLNRGCIPSKALIHLATLYDALRTEGPEVGLITTGAVQLDLSVAQRWKESMIAKERQGVASLLKSAGVTVLAGTVRFTGPRSAELTALDGGKERIDFEQAIVATGAVQVSLSGFEPDGVKVQTAYDVLNWTSVPKSLLVLGGGVSGCELGEFAAASGAEVTIVELMPQLLPGMDPDLARELTRRLEARGVKVLTGTKAVSLDRGRDGVRLTVEKESTKTELSAEKLFVTVGKRPATQDLGLEDAGVLRDPKSGFIPVNDRQATNAADIYAVGDCCRPPMLAHKAYREGVVAAESIAGLSTRFQFRAMPSVVFTVPELATVGMTLTEAQAAGMAAREVRFPYAALGRAHASHATEGWVKLVGDDRSGVVLGFQGAGAGVGELVGEVALAIEMGATVRDLALTIHPHPTFSELLQEVALLWLGEPMHVARRTAPRAS
ncbi:MAG TPA: dihydrolipoyl dehydrogenase [Thermoplasmata archaeon]|nr:dihydrolipoyl dehydrogenase [Thermoplasmata archaeon]